MIEKERKMKKNERGRECVRERGGKERGQRESNRRKRRVVNMENLREMENSKRISKSGNEKRRGLLKKFRECERESVSDRDEGRERERERY
mgnify:CR=1 FL=1